jgi:nicotinate-nucleotide adenylyltransferase
MRVGLLGGTFDPIHVGHLGAASAAASCAHLDRVIFVPSAEPPHRGAAVASAADRLAMCRLAIEGLTGFEVSDVEVRRGGRSYTVDTLREMHERLPGDQLFLILGWDAARMLQAWRDPEVVAELATIVVVSRPGTSAPAVKDLESAGLVHDRVILCLRTTPAVSGSALRAAIAGGEPVSGKVPGAVEEYIGAHRPYPDSVRRPDNRKVES